MISAFIAALGSASEVIIGKFILSKEKMPFKSFIALQCVAIFFVTVFLYFFFGEVNFSAITPVHYLVFFAIIVIAYIYNYLYAYAFKNGKVCDVEPLVMIHPLITMLLAATFYPDERNYKVLIPALVAGAILAYSRIERHHLRVNKYSLAAIAFALLIATETTLVKYMLEVFSPVGFYTIRIGILSVLFLVALRPNLRKVEPKVSLQLVFNGAIIAIEYILIYVAIGQIGLVNTSLIFLLSPVLILFISNIIFKEKMGKKKAIADAIILACIAAAIIIK
jgi:drug/metabolite transporter (DMT)-like permease